MIIGVEYREHSADDYVLESEGEEWREIYRSVKYTLKKYRKRTYYYHYVNEKKRFFLNMD